MKARENGIMSLYGAVIRWILTRDGIPRLNFGLIFGDKMSMTEGGRVPFMVSVNRWFLFLTPILFGGWDLDRRSCGQGEGRVTGI